MSYFATDNWAVRIRDKIERADISYRKAARQAGVHYATFHRAAMGNVPSAETYITINEWLER